MPCVVKLPCICTRFCIAQMTDMVVELCTMKHVENYSGLFKNVFIKAVKGLQFLVTSIGTVLEQQCFSIGML